jgi:hypothetical protein
VFGVAATLFFIYQLNTPLQSLRNTFYLTWTHAIMDQISSLRQPHKDSPRAKDTMPTNIAQIGGPVLKFKIEANI